MLITGSIQLAARGPHPVGPERRKKMRAADKKRKTAMVKRAGDPTAVKTMSISVWKLLSDSRKKAWIKANPRSKFVEVYNREQKAKQRTEKTRQNFEQLKPAEKMAKWGSGIKYIREFLRDAGFKQSRQGAISRQFNLRDGSVVHQRLWVSFDEDRKTWYVEAAESQDRTDRKMKERTFKLPKELLALFVNKPPKGRSSVTAGADMRLKDFDDETTNNIAKMQKMLRAKGYKYRRNLQSALEHLNFEKDGYSLEYNGWHGSGRYGALRIGFELYDTRRSKELNYGPVISAGGDKGEILDDIPIPFGPSRNVPEVVVTKSKQFWKDVFAYIENNA